MREYFTYRTQNHWRNTDFFHIWSCSWQYYSEKFFIKFFIQLKCTNQLFAITKSLFNCVLFYKISVWIASCYFFLSRTGQIISDVFLILTLTFIKQFLLQLNTMVPFLKFWSWTWVRENRKNLHFKLKLLGDLIINSKFVI